jgi:DNA-binding NarL/FixJ family response regulator
MVVHRSDIVAAGIVAILGTAGGFEGVTLVPSVYEAYRVARLNPPRAILFEYDDRQGRESTALLAGITPRPSLVALVDDAHAVDPRDCLGAGADAVVAIDSVSHDRFNAVVRGALRGMTSVVGFPIAGGRDEPAGGPSAEIVGILTPRERQMLYLIGEGLTNQEIAETLVLSVKTVETHRANLSRKLNIRSRAGLIRLAMAGRAPAAVA